MYLTLNTRYIKLKVLFGDGKQIYRLSIVFVRSNYLRLVPDINIYTSLLLYISLVELLVFKKLIFKTYSSESINLARHATLKTKTAKNIF